MEEIPAELILNWDQTGIKFVPSYTWTMDQQGSKRVEVAGANDKRLITAIFCGSLVGDFLPIQVFSSRISFMYDCMLMTTYVSNKYEMHK